MTVAVYRNPDQIKELNPNLHVRKYRSKMLHEPSDFVEFGLSVDVINKGFVDQKRFVARPPHSK